MITVIVPTLNEETTVRRTVEIAKKSKNVNEIIVVDDRSTDNTVSEAKTAGAYVIQSTKLGKGASMRDGLLIAKNEIIAYLDADIENLAEDVVEKITEPILENKADFVKSNYKREAGRVTELVAKPLLSILFPEALKYKQPLSGIIAGKKTLLEKISFEDDYGVDIGILLEMMMVGAKIVEVNVGSIRHKMKLWHELGKMSREVSKAILKRAVSRSQFSLDSLETINLVRNQMEFAIKESVDFLKKMIVFSLDNILWEGRFIDKAAEKFNFQKELAEIMKKPMGPLVMTKHIAKNLKDINIAQIISLVEEIELTKNTESVIPELKNRGYIVGILSNGYDCVVHHVKNKVGADFAFANELEFSNSIATGELKIPSFYLKSDKSNCNHSMCKTNALISVAEQYSISLDNIIAVGSYVDDACMLESAGIGIAFCSDSFALKRVADVVISERSLEHILRVAM